MIQASICTATCCSSNTGINSLTLDHVSLDGKRAVLKLMHFCHNHIFLSYNRRRLCGTKRKYRSCPLPPLSLVNSGLITPMCVCSKFVVCANISQWLWFCVAHVSRTGWGSPLSTSELQINPPHNRTNRTC